MVCGEQLPLRLAGARQCHRPILDPRLSRIDGRCDEVVVVYACETELPFMDRLLREFVDGEAFDFAVAVKNRPAAAGCNCL